MSRGDAVNGGDGASGRGRSIGDRGTAWLRTTGEDHEIVLSTRVRLARNLQGFPFSLRGAREDRERVLERVREVLPSTRLLAEATLWEMSELDPIDRRLLHERHLVSRELIGPDDGPAPAGSALALNAEGPCGLMINEEDHLRLHTLCNGMDLEAAWKHVDALDEELGGMLPFAFHHEFGFLTCCPTNVGTGLRASVLIHLPGLVLTKEINKVLQGIAQVGLTYRGLYGEGSEVVGNFFQISNQTTLGKSEDDLVDHLREIVGQVIEYEKRARAVLLREAPSVLEDKVWRAYGILRHARSLAFDEMMNLLSGVRLGLTLKLLRTPRVRTLNEIMIFAQSAHLERRAGRTLDEGDADVFRAALVRELFFTDEESAASPSESRHDAAD
ncbi:MAG: protein arginine kinase [Gemmatimonadota bacterium]|nr:protein arginine kinase [Gemmatimonadota bacterium]